MMKEALAFNLARYSNSTAKTFIADTETDPDTHS